MGCHIRVFLATGASEYDTYLKSASWMTHRVLLKWEIASIQRSAPVASMRLKLEDVPRHLGQQDVSTYFPHGETAVTKLLKASLLSCCTFTSTRRT